MCQWSPAKALVPPRPGRRQGKRQPHKALVATCQGQGEGQGEGEDQDQDEGEGEDQDQDQDEGEGEDQDNNAALRPQIAPVKALSRLLWPWAPKSVGPAGQASLFSGPSWGENRKKTVFVFKERSKTNGKRSSHIQRYQTFPGAGVF